MSSCLTVKGAEDVLNKQFAFELSTNRDTMYFIADTDKVSLSLQLFRSCSGDVLALGLFWMIVHDVYIPVKQALLFVIFLRIYGSMSNYPHSFR